jgi:uncharacterized protein (TIGR02646 family)
MQIWSNRQVRGALMTLFGGKCAYCESKLSNGLGETDHFRPTASAVRLRKDFSPDHYWWLAYEWDNLLSACEMCSRTKGALAF